MNSKVKYIMKKKNKKYTFIKKYNTPYISYINNTTFSKLIRDCLNISNNNGNYYI